MTRVEKLWELMKKNNLQGFLVASSYNLRYLINSIGTTGLAMITSNKALFITDLRYTEQAAERATGFIIIKSTGHIFGEVADLAERLQLDNLVLEETQVSFAGYSLLGGILPCELVPAVGLIEELRGVRDKEEVAIIEKAYAIVDQGSTFILEMIKPGVIEIEATNQLDFFMRSEGASSVPFETIVTSGLRSAASHGVASYKVIEKGELTTLDFGCYYEGHVFDVARTSAIGSIRPKLKKIYNIVLEAQLEVLAEAKPGLADIQLDTIVWDYIAFCDYSDTSGHSTGHGIGLETHEEPDTSFRADKQFVPGNVITDEPRIYLPGISDMRIEDDLLIIAEDNRVLTHTSKELVIL